MALLHMQWRFLTATWMSWDIRGLPFRATASHLGSLRSKGRSIQPRGTLIQISLRQSAPGSHAGDGLVEASVKSLSRAS
eukprot:1335982-Pyramimonas_sp.AAC.1